MTKDITQLFNLYISECRYATKLSEETLKGCRSCFDTLLKIMPGICLGDISAEIMTTFFQKLDERERVVGRGIIKVGVKRSTIATYRSKFNRFFNWLKLNGQIKENPFDKMAYPDVNYDDRKYIEKNKLEKIIIAVSHGIDWADSFTRKRNYLLITLPLYCGLRRGEILGLMVSDFCPDKKELTVRASTSKSKRQRVIPLNTKIMEIIKDYLQVRKQKGYITPHLFVSGNEDRGLTKDGLKHVMEKIKKEVGFSFHLHLFRHTFAVNLLNGGTDIAKLKQLMGHNDIRMTATYLRCLPTKSMRNDVETLSLDNFL
jgi:site-specific recombinase XerD